MTMAFNGKSLKKSIVLAAILLVACFSIDSSSEQVTPVAPVNLIINPIGAGSITTNSVGAELPIQHFSQETVNMYVNDSTEIIATPNSGYLFAHWSSTDAISIANANSATTTVIVNGNGSITAVFTPQYQVAFATSGNVGSTTFPYGTRTYNANQQMTITAYPDSGYVFVGWQTSNPSITFANRSSATTTATINGGGTITATFKPQLVQPVQVTFDITGGGGSTTSPSGTQNYIAGQVVPITANPANGYSFVSWAVTGSINLANPNAASTTATINGAGTITATFNLPRQPIQIKFVTIGGNSTASPSGTQTFNVGQVVAITANPANGSAFIGWQADPPNAVTFTSSMSANTTATITGNATITAQFTENTASTTDTPTPTSTKGMDVVQISAVAIAVIVIASLGTGFYLAYLSRPSLKKLGRDLKDRHSKEATQEEQEEKTEERDRKRGKPILKLEVKVPPLVWGSKSAKAEGKLVNQGVASAQDIQVSAAATPGLVLDRSAQKIPTLRPLEEKVLTFPFSVNDRIKRGNYKLRFEVKSKQTASRVKDRSLRAMKIGLLSDVEGKSNLVSLKKWLSDRSASWNELTSADNFLKLLEFDLLVVAYTSEIPIKWMKNISNFVDQSQSLLVISGVNTPNTELLAQTLGYKNMSFEDFGQTERCLIVQDNNHEASKNMPLGKEVLLSGWGRTCTSNVDKGLTLAKINIKTKDVVNPLKDFPAIVANNFGEGRTVYLNFCLEQGATYQNEMFESIFNWLLFNNSTCALGEEK